jgi:hypothetical protein
MSNAFKLFPIFYDVSVNWRELAPLVIIMENLGDDYAKTEGERTEEVVKKYIKILTPISSTPIS